MEYNIAIEISNTQAISERVDFIRRQSNLNQEQLAVRLNISQPAVSKYLKDRIPPADILLKLARLGGTTIEWILTGEKKHFLGDRPLVVKDKDHSYAVDTDIQLAYKIARLKPRARQAIKNLIDMLYRQD